MRYLEFRICIFVSIIFLFGSCKNTSKKNTQLAQSYVKNSIEYAKGFGIHDYKDFKKLTIYTSFKGDDTRKEYFLIPKLKEIPDSLKNKNIIRTPIERMVVSSTTHIPMLELLEVENTLVGFPNTSYISSKKTRVLIADDKIKDLGQEQHINIELLIALQPELVVGFGVNNQSQVFKNIQKMGIPVVMNSDWLERTPLGRAEWIRFFGALYDRDSTASERFRTIANNYKTIKRELTKITDKPTVISGALFQDVWNMPAGDSFMAHFLKDAEADYLWKDSSGTGSLSLSLESVLEKGRNAEYWISPGFYTSVNSMINDSPHYEQFSAFKTGTIYTYASKKGATGGVLYFELATTRPDLVLKDLVHIFHPTIFPKNKMTFFDKLK